MKKLLIICIAIFITAFSLFNLASAQTILSPNRGGTGINSATGGDLGLCIKVLDDAPFTYELGSCGSGGGGGGGTFSTTTSQVSGQLINYPNNATDIVAIGSNSTTTSEFWFNPNNGISYFSGNIGVGTTSPYAKLSVVGPVVASYFTGTTTATSTLAGNLDIGSNHLYAHGIQATNSNGVHIHSSNGTEVAYFGITGGADSTFSGGVNIDGATRLATSLTGLLYGTSGAVTATANGTNGFILGMVGGVPTWVATSSMPVAGDVTGTLSSIAVTDDSHAHTGATLSGVDISDDTNLTAGTNITLTGDDLSVDDAFLLNTGDTGTGSYTLSYASTTGFSTTYASSTEWRGGGLVSDCTGASNKITWNSTTGKFACESDVAGSGGTGLATSTAIVDTYVIYGTSASTVGAESAFNYDDATDTLSLGVLTLTTDLSVANGGTGASTLTGLLQGNGTSAITAVTGTAGQYPYYNGTNTLLATSTIFLNTTGYVGIGTTTPASSFDLYGSFSGKVSSITSTTTLDGNYFTVKADTTSSAVGVQLPSAGGACGRVYNIIKSNAGGFKVSIYGTSAQTINGQATTTITSQYTNFQVQSDCANWLVLSNNF